jgi:hypothetical protein
MQILSATELESSTTYGFLIGCLPMGAILGALISPLLMRSLSRK